MTGEDRTDSFLRSVAGPEAPALVKLREENEREGVPLIRKEEEAILSFFASEKKIRQALEIGTGTGYSGILLLSSLPEAAVLTTVERDPERRKKALRHFEEAGFLSRVNSIEGAAEDCLSAFPDGSFELIFLDSAKGQYERLFPELLRLLSPGGVMISDNLFAGGRMLDPRFLVIRRDRTIHENLRRFLDSVLAADELQSMVVPAGDGLLISRKKEKDE